MSLSKLKELAKLRTSGKWEFELDAESKCYNIGVADTNILIADLASRLGDAEFIVALVNSSEMLFQVVEASKAVNDYDGIVNSAPFDELDRALKELEDK